MQKGGNAPPIYEQIIHQLKDLIAKGVLLPGDKIPTIRELAASLVVNPNTIAKAFQELERQHVIETFRGKGTFVAEPVHLPGQEKERLDLLQNNLQKIAVEAKHLGLTKQQFMDWVQELISTYWKEENNEYCNDSTSEL